MGFFFLQIIQLYAQIVKMILTEKQSKEIGVISCFYGQFIYTLICYRYLCVCVCVFDIREDNMIRTATVFSHENRAHSQLWNFKEVSFPSERSPVMPGLKRF